MKATEDRLSAAVHLNPSLERSAGEVGLSLDCQGSEINPPLNRSGSEIDPPQLLRQ